MIETTPRNQRVYVVFAQAANGQVALQFSLTPPTYPSDPLAVLIARGVLPMGHPAEIDLLATAPKQVEQLGTVTLAETLTLAVTLGVRQLTLTNVAGVKAGDAILLVPTSIAAGFLVGNAVATADGTLKVQLLTPALAVGAKYSIPCRVVRLNI